MRSRTAHSTSTSRSCVSRNHEARSTVCLLPARRFRLSNPVVRVGLRCWQPLPLQSFLIFARNLRRLSTLWRYGLATVFVLAAFGARMLLPYDLAGYTFLLFIPAVMLSALLLDHGSGIYASVLSTVLAAYFLMQPVGSFALPRGALIASAVFLLICFSLASVIEVMRKLVDRLDTAERAKDTLLHEANHRFKNNLQIIGSLLTLQGRNQDDPNARAALAAAAERVQVIARIHERFHPRPGGGSVSMRDYLEELGTDLGNSLRGNRPIAVRITADPSEIEVGRAVQIGLIVNELVTNALKYAFPDGRGGAIDVTFRMVEHDMAGEITVRDDGIGYPANTEPGLGTRLVTLLARQLGGELSRTPAEPGCVVRVSVRLRS